MSFIVGLMYLQGALLTPDLRSILLNVKYIPAWDRFAAEFVEQLKFVVNTELSLQRWTGMHPGQQFYPLIVNY